MKPSSYISLSTTLLKNKLCSSALAVFLCTLQGGFSVYFVFTRMRYPFLLSVVALFVVGCKKPEQEVFTDNNIPVYTGTPTLLVENYVNRLYIDLIGREPNDAEMAADVQVLENASLSQQARINL